MSLHDGVSARAGCECLKKKLGGLFLGRDELLCEVRFPLQMIGTVCMGYFRPVILSGH